LIFTFSFVEYISRTSSQDYGDNIESPPKQIIFVNENDKLEETVNTKYNQSSTSVHKKRHFPHDLNYPLASSPEAGKSIVNFDLNQTPPAEEE